MRRTLTAALLGFMITLTSSAAAEIYQIEIDVKNAPTPDAVVGLLLTSDGTTEVTETEIIEGPDGTLLVSFPYESEEIVQETLATALVKSANGEVAFGSMKPVHTPGPKDSFLRVPECPIEPTPVRFQSQLSSIEHLVKIRSEHRVNRYKLVSQVLSGDLLNQLKKFEKGFGLQTGTELSADLHPVELVDRLSRLHHALRNATVHHERNAARAREQE